MSVIQSDNTAKNRKIREGFVSNSSSSSYIVCELKNNFAVINFEAVPVTSFAPRSGKEPKVILEYDGKGVSTRYGRTGVNRVSDYTVEFEGKHRRVRWTCYRYSFCYFIKVKGKTIYFVDLTETK